MSLSLLNWTFPANWAEATIQDITSKVGSGATPRGGASVYVDSGTPFIRSQNIYDHEFRYGGLAMIDDYSSRQLQGVTLFKGDVLINITGDSILRCCVLPDTLAGGRVNQHVAIIRPIFKSVDPIFLQKWLTLPAMKEIMLGFSSGGTRKAITKGHILRFPVALPPLHEQRGIAATLGALDDKIESNRRIARLAEEIILAYFEKYFDISEQENGIAISNLIAVNPKYRLKKGVEAIKISMADLPENSAIISTWNKEIVAGGQRFTNGDVLFARITPCLENGKTSIVDMLDDASVGFGSTEFIVLSPKGNIKTAWIYAFARNKSVRTWAARNMTGTSGRQRFQASFFDGYLISPPSEKMIENFNLIANPFTQKLTQIRDENLKLESLRDALLPELMSGRICVPEAQEAIAEVIPEEDGEHASKTSRG